MGHERLGVLPKTKRWRDIVQSITEFGERGSHAADIASRTARNVQSRYRNMGRDSGVQAAFRFLVALASSCLDDERERYLRKLGVDFEMEPTPLSVATAVSHWVDSNRNSLEYASLAQAAAADAIVDWCARHATRQQHLFDGLPQGYEVWREAGTGAGFCEFARSFFAHLTTRYLNYFLEREASAACRSIQERDRFEQAMKKHVDEVSQHAFETSFITQSFAAGWYNKNAREATPDSDAIAGFLAIAFGKMGEELLRETD